MCELGGQTLEKHFHALFHPALDSWEVAISGSTDVKNQMQRFNFLRQLMCRATRKGLLTGRTSTVRARMFSHVCLWEGGRGPLKGGDPASIHVAFIPASIVNFLDCNIAHFPETGRNPGSDGARIWKEAYAGLDCDVDNH